MNTIKMMWIKIVRYFQRLKRVRRYETEDGDYYLLIDRKSAKLMRIFDRSKYGYCSELVKYFDRRYRK